MGDRQPLPHDQDRVKEALQARIEGVVSALGFSEPTRNGVITPLNPRRKDRRPGSFVIWIGRTPGAWKDYATDEKGDVFDLIRYVERLDRWIDAYWWSLNFLGWGRHEVRTADQVRLDREAAERERKAAAAREGAEREAKAGKARWFWANECEPRWGPGTAPWTYLVDARGLPLERLPHLPNAIRWRPALEHFDKETGEVTTWPAMTTAMSGPDGAVTACHITWLAPDGRGKAPVSPAKKMRGVAQGAAMRLWKGASKLSPEAAAAKGVTGPLIITEGIEDAITAAVARPECRVWAAGSLAGLDGLAWPACASSVVLVADNDWDTPEAISAFERAEAKWQAMAKGRPLKVVRAEVGKDLNDWARGVAA